MPAAIRNVARETLNHGNLSLGMAGIYNEPIMPRYIEFGARFILAGQDGGFLTAGAAQRTGFLHKLHD